MISLKIAAEAPLAVAPFVVRIGASSTNTVEDALSSPVVNVSSSRLELSTAVGPLFLENVQHEDCAGDVLLVSPERRIADRLIRAGSPHNTFLVTEQCDQFCLMCSQPPKKHHNDLFRHFETAALLAPRDMVIGISGGEPMLHKEELFSFLERVAARRPDLSFHVLTNAQHFSEGDGKRLLAAAFQRVLWGIPLYATKPDLHDMIVNKAGAFLRLQDSFALLARCGAQIELRTVVLKQNAHDLPELAAFIALHLPFVRRWAIMQLENIGFARRSWQELFYDHSLDFEAVAAAADIAQARGTNLRLFNFPLCTVPQPYRVLADSSISDWKRRYLSECDMCSVRSGCTGFFEWYPDRNGFKNVTRQ